MKRTITAMFDRYQDAAEAVRRLEAAGIARTDLSVVSNDEAHKEYQGNTAYDYRDRTDTADDASDGAGTGASLGTVLGGGAGLLAGLGMLAIPGLGPVVAAGWLASTLIGAGAGAATGGLVGSLAGAGVSKTDAESYSEGVRRGGTLVTARVEEADFDRALDILDDEGTVDMDEREKTWRGEGWTGSPTGSSDYAPGTTGSMASGAVGAAAPTATGLGIGSSTDTSRTGMGKPSTGTAIPATGMAASAATASRGASKGEEVIPVVEETLNVGKREVSGGRVRVRSYTTETPVQEQVTLRDENVSVERRPVDRAMTGTDNFKDRTIEATEKHEEAVVSKDARVKEELVVKKDVEQETRTVSDTVRQTKVEVDDDRNARVGGMTGSKTDQTKR